jgi:hypothetical protein
LFSSANERQLFTVGRPSPSTPLNVYQECISAFFHLPSHRRAKNDGDFAKGGAFSLATAGKFCA